MISQGLLTSPVLRPTARIGTSNQIHGAIQMNLRIPLLSETVQVQLTVEMGQGSFAKSPPVAIAVK